MFVEIQANILSVGVPDKVNVLSELPVKLIKVNTGAQAIRQLRQVNIEGIVTNWNLQDMPQGGFVKALKKVKSWIPTIVLVQPGQTSDEIAARALGVTAVLNTAGNIILLRKTVINALKINEKVHHKSLPANHQYW